ncbi:MAG: hypothetical protein HC845_01145 [Akkermansiaceae bacterium]|nr:hypothetical protein [Akkermansiaceae bacterium]
MDWLKKNGASYPDLADEDALQTIISGAAQKDPKLAFDLLDKGNPDDLADGISSIAEAAKMESKGRRY